MATDTSATTGAAANGAAAGAGAGPWGAVAGAGLGILGSVLGGNAASKAAAAAAAQQQAAFERNKALLESIGIPSVDAQEIALKNPEYVGDLVAQTQGNSALTDISTDPKMRQNQLDQIAQLKGLSQTGLGTTDRIALDQAQSQATQADKARRASILSQMAQRGTLDSGSSLAAQLQSTQQANQDALAKSQNIASQASQNRMNAINSLATQSGALDNTDYNRAASAATAQDAIQRFNVGTRNSVAASNQAARQNIANQSAANANQQEIYNKGLLQQDYNNRLGKAKSEIGLDSGNAQNQAQNTLTAGAGQANMYSQIGQGLGNATKGLVDYYGNPTTDPTKAVK